MTDFDDDNSATTSTGQETTLTLAKLRQAIALIPPEPFAEFMKKEGCDPADGWVLAIPIRFEREFSGRLPRYVIVSHYIAEPILMNPDRMRLG
jgi:hypothetical protein